MGGHWSYKVKLKDSDGKTIAKFDLDQEKWKPFAEKVSSKLNKKLIGNGDPPLSNWIILGLEHVTSPDHTQGGMQSILSEEN